MNFDNMTYDYLLYFLAWTILIIIYYNVVNNNKKPLPKLYHNGADYYYM